MRYQGNNDEWSISYKLFDRCIYQCVQAVIWIQYCFQVYCLTLIVQSKTSLSKPDGNQNLKMEKISQSVKTQFNSQGLFVCLFCSKYYQTKGKKTIRDPQTLIREKITSDNCKWTTRYFNHSKTFIYTQ